MKNTYLVLIKNLCKGRVFIIMKKFDIVASKEVVASFQMDYNTFKMKFAFSAQLVDFIVDKYPEYKDVPYNVDFPDDKVVVEFYSLGNLVVEEG